MSFKATHLKTDARRIPMGIDNSNPEFSWMLEGSSGNLQQSAYAIQVSVDEGFTSLVWDSGRVEGGAQFNVKYQGLPLTSCQRYYWRVQAWLGEEQPSAWSQSSWFETAFLDAGKLQASWITLNPNVNADKESAIYLRRVVQLPCDVVKARAYVSALGWYRFFLNEHDLTGNALVPRWTPLDQAVEYQTYDVTRYFQRGSNVVAMAIGDGRYRGRLGVLARREVYGDQLAGFVRIELELVDGSRQVICSDDQWESGLGSIRHSDPQSGESVDLRISDTSWFATPIKLPESQPASYLPPNPRQLIAEQTGRVREVMRLKPVRIFRSPSGKQLVDFGQNFAGVIRLRVPANHGQSVQLTYSELLNQSGELDIEYLKLPMPNMPNVLQRDEVVLGKVEQWFQPWFTIHGFRFVEVVGLDVDLQNDQIEGIALSSELAETGSFECSDARLNKLHQNVLWSLRSNFVDTPTDCPTRERSGWTGDIQIFANTSMMMVDSQAYLKRFLRNLSWEQLADGRVPPFIPSETSRFSGIKNYFINLVSTSAGWGDVTIMLPWSLYQYRGDTDVLARQYTSMQKWLESLRKLAEKRGRARMFSKRLGEHEQYIVDGGYHWGEWLRAGDGIPHILKAAFVPEARVATAYFANSSRLLSEIAMLLGRDADSKLYFDLWLKVRSAWRAAFIDANGCIGADRQDDYVRALAFGLLEPTEESAAVNRLVDRIAAKGYHLETGFLSTPMLLPTLAKFGRADVAYKLLLQTTVPSWLGQIELGATTTWETWEGYKPNGKAQMSHNHYAFGAVVGWLYEAVAGLSPVEPGYRRFRVSPCIGGGLTHASASVETPYGQARSAWKIECGQMHIEVVVPMGTSADVHLGDGRIESVSAGTHHFSCSQSTARQPADKAACA